ncbi:MULTISPECIES: imidazolonepropionase [unclassified Thalassospira]|uniref:imidazolonepropionase n=1 Tax=unclassified Thalassospira TaxID=2648997 RepID=UPI0018CED0A2|nr:MULTISPECIES: imidazolonepropionase [unclassified Thalassospira]QPO12369.1 imidazolonepropionase [Thalassospira sp. A40-3]|tara:strand:- start:307 stop:1509 length:1203 start_codon:yes stop_codon:yes gene_type:complete
MLLRNAKIVTIEDQDSYGLIECGAIAIKDGLIDWVGADDAIPAEYLDGPARDLEGRLITPALIDCHTHVVHGGDRAVEFEMRLKGASYEEVARAGGGIVSTVKATREASIEDLLASALPRVDALLAEGVSVIEVKSGYGLDRETELNMLRAARQIADHRNVRIKTTFLGAHAVPVEYKYNPDGYIDDVCIPALKAAHAEGLVDAVDGFCEGIAFNTDQIKRVFDVARALGIPVKLHAEQLSNIGGTKLAAEYGAMSVDHIEYATEEDAIAMAKAGSVAVLLPGAFYTLHETQLPPIDAFRKHGVPMAIATDCNPGSSPLASILLTMNMSCTLFRLTPEEALVGATAHAARALGLSDTGRIKPGLRADLAIWNAKHPAELAYRIGFNPLFERIVGGESTAA